jgi:hypothetical protein
VPYGIFSLGYQRQGCVVEVCLSGVESDVFLVDSPNLAALDRGMQFRYYGGHYKASPACLAIPTSGTWAIVVVPGVGGTVQATVKMLTCA